jgi:hypothetical protein
MISTEYFSILSVKRARKHIKPFRLPPSHRSLKHERSKPAHKITSAYRDRWEHNTETQAPYILTILPLFGAHSFFYISRLSWDPPHWPAISTHLLVAWIGEHIVIYFRYWQGEGEGVARHFISFLSFSFASWPRLPLFLCTLLSGREDSIDEIIYMYTYIHTYAFNFGPHKCIPCWGREDVREGGRERTING